MNYELNNFTVEEKIRLLVGDGHWNTFGIK